MSFTANWFLSLCLLTVAVGVGVGVAAERIRYDNYKVYKATASSAAELQTLKSLDGASDSIMFLDGIHSVNKQINVIVAPHKVADFSSIMSSNKIDFNLVENNMQSHLEADNEPVAKLAHSFQAAAYGWKKYYSLHDTYKWMRQLSVEYPGIVTLIEGGKTHEHRSILGVKISKNKYSRPGIFLEAGMHAREWISSATVTYMLNQLLSSKNSAVQEIAKNYDWYIFPHTNPDGYVYTHTTDRLWRKTRRRYGNCFGADPNRNWAFEWNSIGSSNNSCSDTYAGPAAFSEIETKTFSDYIASLKGKLFLYISFHAFSQLLLYPYGHSASLPSNHKDLAQIFNVTVAAMKQRYGTAYTGGNIFDAIYPTSGTSIDWAYERAGIKMAFCFELRPSAEASWSGFSLPAAQIIPTGEETLDAITAMVNEIEKLGYFK